MITWTRVQRYSLDVTDLSKSDFARSLCNYLAMRFMRFCSFLLNLSRIGVCFGKQFHDAFITNCKFTGICNMIFFTYRYKKYLSVCEA